MILTKEQFAAIELPDFSLAVLKVLESMMYAEPGFSDVMADDIARELGVSRQAVGGAIAELVKLDIVYVEYTDINMEKRSFLHTYAWDYNVESICLTGED